MSTHSEPNKTDPGLRVRCIAGRQIVFDGDGFFNDFYDWSEAAFGFLAEESGLVCITEQHRQVVHFLREFYAYHGRSPLNRQIKEGTGLSALELQQLFPEGIKQGARRLAGLPNPKTCS
ncbi:MAG: TusE/DsrC/DsvC family sulfur relay protein [Syntrophobacteraceae bacterium]|jgi:tRNA 2-thiouridine synthesizing protein E